MRPIPGTGIFPASSLFFPVAPGSIFPPAGLGPFFRTSPAELPGGGGGGTTPAPFQAYVWTNSNLISSGLGDTKIVSLAGLPEGARELHGKWANVSGQTKLDGKFLQVPFDGTSRPTPGGILQNVITRDGFDQVQAYHAITSLMVYLGGLGFNMGQVIRKLMPIVAAVNAVDDLNAWFDPSRRNGVDLTFGTAKGSRYGEWHLASDQEIVEHEVGHLILYCINALLTSWYARDGGAIHEGFGDGISTLHWNDPEASEDFSAAIGEEYGTMRGLRTVANALKYNEVDREVHSLGRVYGAFWWAVRTALEPLLGKNGRAAADLTAAFLVEHGSHYTTNKPGPRDFLDAAIVGAKTYLEGSGKFSVEHAKVQEIMMAAARERAMIGENQAMPLDGRSVDLTSLASFMLQHADRFGFMLDSAARGTFGGRDFLQQYLMLGGDNPLRMMGSGLILFRNREGEVKSFSNRDLRLEVKLDPTVNINLADALKAILLEARKQLKESKRAEDALGAQGATVPDREVWEAQMRRRADEMTLAAAREKEELRLRAELVVMPEGYENQGAESHLHYRFDLGPSEFYVDAKTGHVAVKKMPMW